VLEADSQIIGVSHDDHVAGGFAPSPALGPDIEAVVQVDIGDYSSPGPDLHRLDRTSFLAHQCPSLNFCFRPKGDIRSAGLSCCCTLAQTGYDRPLRAGSRDCVDGESLQSAAYCIIYAMPNAIHTDFPD